MSLALYCAAFAVIGFAWGYALGWMMDMLEAKDGKRYTHALNTGLSYGWLSSDEARSLLRGER